MPLPRNPVARKRILTLRGKQKRREFWDQWFPIILALTFSVGASALMLYLDFTRLQLAI